MDNQTLISSEEQVRNWIDLPLDILAHIFLRLGVVDILLRAQSVCSVWRNLSKHPMLFRSIDLRKRWGIYEHMDMQRLRKKL
ncbi:hypothetical protein MKW98_001468 [Papaver atlanticum]|uniref:F-box domain-containing protein n=1 Tax=Papaver atlanticum TaxID=357466 RepID=A0AAD4SYL8_9MAGN|nr:hypothetical protein MKW98_001468 [Papaver atlanticum]